MVLASQKLPKDAKLVVALRDMGDCIVSMHKFWHPMVCFIASDCGGRHVSSRGNDHGCVRTRYRWTRRG